MDYLTKRKVVYCTTSQFKREELRHFVEGQTVSVPTPTGNLDIKIADLFRIDFRAEELTEILECDLSKMVRIKAMRAYQRVMVPCIVEHAGLIFKDYKDKSYPGGLTQPMWDTLEAEKFLVETHGKNRPAIARAVIGFCDGKTISTFIGETEGVLSDAPRGKREFYWDTVFCPTLADGTSSRTYAEIVAENGLQAKAAMSQSGKALKAFVQTMVSSDKLRDFNPA